MTMSYLEYELHNGYIHNWLVAGPHARAVSNVPEGDEASAKLKIAQDFYDASSEIADLPVDRTTFTLGETDLTWAYTRCFDDHFVNLSTFHHTWHYLRAWAYAQVDVWETQDVTFVLTTNGPADVWINGEHVHRQEHFHHQQPKRVTFTATLRADDDAGTTNAILVRFEEVAARECPYVMALQIVGLEDEEAVVKIPTSIARVARQLTFERAFEQTYLDQLVNHRGASFNLCWSEDLDVRCNYSYQIMDARDHIYVSGALEAKPGEVIDVGHGFRLWERPYRVVLRARSEDYYEHDLRYQWALPIYVLDEPYVEKYETEPEDRREQALAYATERKGNVFAEIAKMALGKWETLDLDVIMHTISGINQRGDCSDFYLVGLLGVMFRFMDDAAFPDSLKQPLKDCVLNFKYWHDEPGTDAMCYTTENHSILFHTCEILAGQLYPDALFTNTGKTGAWHREKGERLALDWLRQRGAYGFQEWDSNCYFEEDVLALSHLADLAENEVVLELAAVVMDKLFFTMAVNSFKGVFGSTHGRTYARMLKGSRLEATSGMCQLMFGVGGYNPSIRAVVSLACSAYELPTHIVLIANDLPDEMWNRERHVGKPGQADSAVNKVTYKTPDYMLCSAQDYRPGERGYQQHIWQATFDHQAVVFVTHPANMSEQGAHRPNFWCGNFVLPRVAQWKDVLVALHKLPEDDWMGFTHAFFPAPAFDDYVIQGNWAFARKGEGYLALYAAQGLTLIKRGPSAYYELRSFGSENVWLCQMGRAAQDGTFEEFQHKVLALEVKVSGLDVVAETLRGQALVFGWEGAFQVDGEAYPLSDFKHYENPYCVADLPTAHMGIRFDDYLLDLDFTETDTEI